MGVVKVWGRGNGKVGPLVKRRIANLGLQWVVAMTPSKAMKARLPALRDRQRQGHRFVDLRRRDAVPWGAKAAASSSSSDTILEVPGPRFGRSRRRRVARS